MAELNFSTGLVAFNINGAVELCFNPTDAAFVERLYSAFEALDKKQESYKKAVDGMKNSREIFDFARERDAEMRQILDTTLGAPVSDALFGDMNVYAMANGLPVWSNLLLALMDEIDSAFVREQKATNPRIAKYTAKYKK